MNASNGALFPLDYGGDWNVSLGAIHHYIVRVFAIFGIIVCLSLLDLKVVHASTFESYQEDSMTDTNDDTLPMQAAPIERKPAETEFRLQFNVEGGVVYPNGLYPWMTTLVVKGGSAPRAAMYLNRHNGDLIGRPIGLFSDSLSASRAQQIDERFAEMDFAGLPAPTDGDVTGSTLHLDYQKGFRIIRRTFNSSNHDFLLAAAPIMDELRDLMSYLLTKPERAIAISLETTEVQGKRLSFDFRVTNIGEHDVVIADPRVGSLDPLQPRAFVQVALLPESVPGEMEIPPQWQTLALEEVPGQVLEGGHTIRPKESLVVKSKIWTAPANGEYVAQAIWQDYQGPPDIDMSLVQPLVPADVTQNEQPFVVRGSAFSSYLKFVVGNNQD